MYFLKSVIDILVVLLLLRLLIRPNEALFNPIYGLIYRVTDFLLTPSRYVTRNSMPGVLLTVLALVVLRGTIYVSLKPMPFVSGVGISLLSFFQFLFQVYMVMWFIWVLTQAGFGPSFSRMIDRAFTPLDFLFGRLGFARNRFRLLVFLFLWILYSVLSILVRSAFIARAGFPAFTFVDSLAEGLLLVLVLFPFPGFFSLVIVVGVLLSWVNPDPSNPIVQAIYGISEPLLMPFRRVVPHLGGMDFSPLVALLCFQILGWVGYQLIDSITKAI